MIYTATAIAQTVAANQLLAGGMPELAIDVLRPDDAPTVDERLTSLPGLEVDDSGYGWSKRYTFLEQGVRIWTLMDRVVVEAQIQTGEWKGTPVVDWRGVAEVNTTYLELGATVEVVEAILTSRA